jgi:hypothetical protein
MKRLLLALPALATLLIGGTANAQTASPEMTKDLWCGTALVMVFSSPARPDATADQLAEMKTYLDGGNMLLDRATDEHKAAGFTDQQIADLKSATSSKVTLQLQGDGKQADYSFPECAALLNPAETVAPDAAAPQSSASSAQPEAAPMAPSAPPAASSSSAAPAP